MSDAARPAARPAVERALRQHWGRLLALLTRQLRSLDLAEESLAHAFERALTTWDPPPDNEAAWLHTAARHRAVDLLRRERALARRLPLLVTDEPAEDPGADPDDEVTVIPDERLRLLFTCCHPALTMEARVALTLRCVGGLTTPAVARLFLVTEPTMAARITRAKKKIATAGIPYRVPADAELPVRLPGVLAVLYLIFTEGYVASPRRELAAEAIRLTRVLVALLPAEPEARGLLALMLLQHSRRDARHTAAGELVRLPDQDRARWHADEIAEALALLREPVGPAADPYGPYALQAAIAARHAMAADARDTDWAAIAELYAELETMTGSPVVRLNRAVAVAEVAGAAAGLALLDGLRMPRHHLLPAIRADLLRRLGRPDEARAAYAEALELVDDEAERAFLHSRLTEVETETEHETGHETGHGARLARRRRTPGF